MIGFTSPTPDEVRKLADSYEAGWNDAMEAAIEEILKTPGRIGFKQAASILRALKDAR